ncbi:hypothetical protein QF027_003210 [Streptomyces canus]|nr:hypothetical protein [Streptomyces canus]
MPPFRRGGVRLVRRSRAAAASRTSISSSTSVKTASLTRHFSRDIPYAAIELTNRPPVTVTRPGPRRRVGQLDVGELATPGQRPLVMRGLGERTRPPGRRHRRQRPLTGRPRVRAVLQSLPAPDLQVPGGEGPEVRADQREDLLIGGRQLLEPRTDRHQAPATRPPHTPCTARRPLPGQRLQTSAGALRTHSHTPEHTVVSLSGTPITGTTPSPSSSDSGGGYGY